MNEISTIPSPLFSTPHLPTPLPTPLNHTQTLPQIPPSVLDGAFLKRFHLPLPSSTSSSANKSQEDVEDHRQNSHRPPPSSTLVFNNSTLKDLRNSSSADAIVRVDHFDDGREETLREVAKISPRLMTFFKNYFTCGNILCGNELTYLLLFMLIRLALGSISNSIILSITKAILVLIYPYIGDVVGTTLASWGITFGRMLQ